MFKGLAGILGGDLAIDLGTANTRIYCPDRGLVLEEPSLVFVQNSGLSKPQVLAVGAEARSYAANSQRDGALVHPIQDGAVADPELAQIMVHHFLQKVIRRRLMKPQVAIAIAHDATPLARRAMRAVLLQAGAARVYPIEKSVAAAWGLDLIRAPGLCTIDIGQSTTEIGVLSLGKVVRAHTLGWGGDTLDAAIMHYVRRHHGCILSPATAAEIKETIGSALPYFGVQTLEVAAKELRGQSTRLVLDSNQVREALQPPLTLLLSEISTLLESLEAPLLAAVKDTELRLMGGGSLLARFDQRLAEAVGMTVQFAIAPQHCVVRGTLGALDRVPMTVS